MIDDHLPLSSPLPVAAAEGEHARMLAAAAEAEERVKIGIDLGLMRDFMSDEDFAALLEDGLSPRRSPRLIASKEVTTRLI